ncbi:transporter substrate-binding domain-containing protein [Terasakiella sp. SH-1]|uniref:substrate-binding periplasmic protein n=1 Tax=Terasakiella sp. SH-1 TaxID=2560057 RepID=UPI0014300009|nr:transporter substrate-binding domain-containing protein [Terasakiella sp. SH-1]
MAFLVCGLSFLLCLKNADAANGASLLLVNDDYPPFNSPTMAQEGLGTGIVRMALGRSGYRLKTDYYPWKRALSMAEKAEADGIIGAWYKKDREKYFLYSKPYMANNLKLLTRSVFLPKGFTVGLIRGYGYNAATLKRFEKRIVYVSHLAQGIKMLEHGRVDAILEDELVLQHYLNRNISHWKRIYVLHKEVIESKPLHLMIRAGHPDGAAIIADFNQALRELQNNGQIKSLFEQLGYEFSSFIKREGEEKAQN